MTSGIASSLARPTTAVPAEWAPQRAVWVGWPSHPDLWLDNLDPARREIAALVHAIAEHQTVRLAACGESAYTEAKRTFPNRNVEVFNIPFGDIWLRDTGPIFTTDGRAFRFQNNGWGGKYTLPHDDTVGDGIAQAERAPILRHDFILEGGAIEQNGQGTLLTTRQCLLNPNRNKGWNQQTAESALMTAFGVENILWLDEGLAGDHTDGHIDNLARFVDEHTLLCQSPFGSDDPNAELYEDIIASLSAMRDAQGHHLNVKTIPSPGLIEGEDGDPAAASHMNFVITNGAIIMPTYGSDSAPAALDVLHTLFPSRKVVGLPSGAVLSGGGSFHCITQQVPA